LTRVAVLADDLIWATRLDRLVRAAGADVVRVGSEAALRDAIDGGVEAAIIDLTARGYDAVAAIGLASAAGRPVLAVGQHDDAATRDRARAAGAGRVLAYRAVSDDGEATVGAFVGRLAATR